MIVTFEHNHGTYRVDITKPLDISIALEASDKQPNAFYAPMFSAAPLQAGDFIGSTKAGSPVNFFNVQLNPHGNGTHTECVGHIAKETYTINHCLQQFWFLADLVSIYPEKQANGDRMITHEQLATALPDELGDAVIVRTLPNEEEKKSRSYSGNNPPYMQPEAMEWLRKRGVRHFLIDLPSVDREEDGGKLAAHKAFWNYPNEPRCASTISELIFVPDEIKDGRYLLNIHIISLELDVSPSKPVLYAIQNH